MQGKIINGYTIQSLLGVGGMAEVWLAENAIGKKAAVKLLLPKFCGDEGIVARFQNEAKVMVQLDHPNIRQVYDFGNLEGRPVIVMEYLEGDDLKAMMKQGRRFTNDELVKWWDQIVDALNYTHRKGIVHRDIKPSNIFIDREGNVKLLDFGIAKVVDTTSGTMTGSTLGTRIYMSPEQVKDPKRVGAASDIYSLAVSFVHLLTGKAPYDSTTSSDFDIQVSIVSKPVDLSPLPEDWRGFLAPYLAKEPDQRPALRHFEVVEPQDEPQEQPEEPEDEGTIIAGTQPKPTPKPEPKKPEPKKPTPKPDPKSPQTPIRPTKPISPTQPASPNPSDSVKPKSKTGLWIGLGAAVAALVVAVLLLKPKEPVESPDTQAYNACETVDDYRSYLSYYGRGAEHYAEAKQFVEAYMADSTAKAQQLAAQQLAERKDLLHGLVPVKAEAEKKAQQTHQTQQATTGSANGHEWVDLGLPSGTLWATCNMGASKPEGYGSYYAWGETSTKSDYSLSSYKYAEGTFWYDPKLTKYCSKSDYGNNGFTDKLKELQSGDDPATSWGSGWRTPTAAQWDELLSNTTNQWTKQNGVNGRLFTSMKNGQTLFLPAAGSRWDTELLGAGSDGYYWSRSLYTDDPSYAVILYFYSDDCSMDYDYYRDSGFSVRSVLQK